MARNGQPKNTVECGVCHRIIGAVGDDFSNHRSTNNVLPGVWKTSVHHTNGSRCPGSRVSVSKDQIWGAGERVAT